MYVYHPNNLIQGYYKLLGTLVFSFFLNLWRKCYILMSITTNKQNTHIPTTPIVRLSTLPKMLKSGGICLDNMESFQELN